MQEEGVAGLNEEATPEQRPCLRNNKNIVKIYT
jgi:hypothetical protein